MAVNLMPQEWLLLIGRPVPRDDSATDWDARDKIAWPWRATPATPAALAHDLLYALGKRLPQDGET